VRARTNVPARAGANAIAIPTRAAGDDDQRADGYAVAGARARAPRVLAARLAAAADLGGHPHESQPTHAPAAREWRR
jgi:hypothetical protein